MWQRKQTIYLLLTIFLMIGAAILGQEELGALISFAPAGVIGLMSLAAIFLYKNQSQRKSQMLICRFSQIILVVWLGYSLYFHFVLLDNAPLKFYPFVILAAIFVLELARKGVKADYDMIRSQDRIR